MNDGLAGSRVPENRGRLALSLGVSAAIHVAGLLGMQVAGSYAVVADANGQPRLTATITENKRESAAAPPELPEPAAPRETIPPLPVSSSASGPSSPEQRQARFVLPPDFSELERYPAPLGRRLVVRIEVLASGFPGNIAMAESDAPIPEPALETLYRILRLARYQPAVIDGKAVASTLEIALDVQATNTEVVRPVPLAAETPRSPGPPDPAAHR